MTDLIKIDPIAVKDKNEVVQALTILEKIGIHVMSDEKKENYLRDDSKHVEDNFMIQEKDGGFRIQSHYIGFGISIESLQKQVEEILSKIPDIKEKITDFEETKIKMLKEIEEKTKQVNIYIDENRDLGRVCRYGIHLKEKN